MDKNTLALVIPALTPLIILSIKTLWKQVPSVMLPYLAPIIGALLVMLGNATDTINISPILGMFLGAAGVGLREMLDQTKQKLSSDKLDK